MTIKLRAPHLPRWRLSLPKVSRPVAQSTAQSVGALAVLIGIAHWSNAASWIVGGLTLIMAIERQAT